MVRNKVSHAFPSQPRSKTTKQTKRRVMNDKFDELRKSLARSVTCRAALKRFGVGLTGIALAAGALCVTGFGEKNYRLGGAWVGGSSIYTWSVLFAPSDPAGQTA